MSHGVTEIKIVLINNYNMIHTFSHACTHQRGDGGGGGGKWRVLNASVLYESVAEQ